jgi:hypothetical protein
MSVKGILGLHPLPFSLLSGHHEVSSSSLPWTSYHDDLPHHRPKVMGPSKEGLKPQKLVAKLSISSL